MQGESSRANSNSSLSGRGAGARQETPISALDMNEDAVHDLHRSRSEQSPIAHNVVSGTDSEATRLDPQPSLETEDPDGGSSFELLGRLAGGGASDGQLSLEQEADNLVHRESSHPSPWIPLSHPHVTLASVADFKLIVFLYGTALIFKSYIDKAAPSEGWGHF